MFLFVQCVAVSAYLSGITVTKKRHRIKDFLLCQFFAGAKYGRIVFLPDKTVIKQTKFVKFSLGRWMTLKRQEALTHS